VVGSKGRHNDVFAMKVAFLAWLVFSVHSAIDKMQSHMRAQSHVLTPHQGS
jgi:hypothetical protein